MTLQNFCLIKENIIFRKSFSSGFKTWNLLDKSNLLKVAKATSLTPQHLRGPVTSCQRNQMSHSFPVMETTENFTANTLCESHLHLLVPDFSGLDCQVRLQFLIEGKVPLLSFQPFISLPLPELPRQVLPGHEGRVTCLLYPFNESTRYDPQHLLSGGADFSVCLWDLDRGVKLHTFTVHGGPLSQLMVPPSNCNVRKHCGGCRWVMRGFYFSLGINFSNRPPCLPVLPPQWCLFSKAKAVIG